MTVYAYTPERIEQIIARNRAVRLWLCIAAGGVIVVALCAILSRPSWLPTIREWIVPLALAAVLPLFRNVRRWSSAPDAWRDALTGRKVEITSSSLRIWYSPSTIKEVEQEDIRRVEEPKVGGGLYVRTTIKH
jgi:hypothetical protein